METTEMPTEGEWVEQLWDEQGDAESVDKIDIIHVIGRNLGICPKCGNGNAMLDRSVIDESGNRFEDLECRDCGHYCHEGLYRNVQINLDNKAREFTGVASVGIVVTLASFEGAGLTKYLKAYPTPEDW